MSLKVINEITEEVKTFKSIPEFDAYYQKHKDEMNRQSTQYLNKVYKIKTPDDAEYRITKKNCQKEGGKMVYGDVFLKRVNHKSDDQDMMRDLEDMVRKNGEEIKSELRSEMNSVIDQNDDMNAKINSLQQSLSVLEKKVIEITRTLNQFVNVVNQLTGNSVGNE